MLKLTGKSDIMNWVNERKQGNTMRNGKQSASRMIISILSLTAMMVMVSCSSAKSEAEETLVSLGKEGMIQSNIVESFSESYYDEAELQQSILSQAAAYNRMNENGSIKVEKVEVKDGTALVSMTYAKAKDYASFNRAFFFVGEAQAAAEEGYELNVVLSGVKDSGETIGKADILAMNGVTLLITDISDAIALNGKALYVSGNVTVSGNANTVRRSAEDDGLAYIIFK